MPKCPVCYGYPFDGERCPICGFPADPQRIAYWELVYRHPEKPEELFRRPFPIDYERAKVWKKMLETRGYEARIMPVYAKSNPQEILIPTMPMNWFYVGAFIDGEGSASYHYTPEGTLRAMISIGQSDKIRSGHELLTKIKDFIKKELNIQGHIYQSRAEPKLYLLEYTALEDCYILSAAVLPYLKHPEKIEKFTSLIKEIENYTRRTRTETLAQIPLAPPKRKPTLYRILSLQERRLATIEKTKQQYPYLKTL
jgi:hypothetical protein